ncbi:MAG: metal ABC transporter permease [Thermodesulfobacteriota bacterium]
MNTFSEFINSFYLWREAFIVASVSGAICGFLGVYVILRRIVFVSVALTQISSFGVVLAFFIQTLSIGALASLIDPFIFSILITSLAALFFALKKNYFPVSQEAIIGFGFIITSALILILGSSLPQGVDDVESVLFGSAVLVDAKDVFIIPINALLVFVVHVILFKDLLFVSFDNETAKLFNYPVEILNIVLYLSLAVVIALTTRALGALPVFALLVLPPMISFQLLENIKAIFILSIVLGVISAMLGFYFSFEFSLPTGASIAFCASILFLISFILREFKIFLLSFMNRLGI